MWRLLVLMREISHQQETVKVSNGTRTQATSFGLKPSIFSIQENADFQDCKLELLVVNLKSNLENAKADFECANMDMQKLATATQLQDASLQKATRQIDYKG